MSQKQTKEILVTGVFGFVDVLISLWDQKVKGQGHIAGGGITVDRSPSSSISFDRMSIVVNL